jgi:hypothetical protein
MNSKWMRKPAWTIQQEIFDMDQGRSIKSLPREIAQTMAGWEPIEVPV